jgi:Flp pilus assembly pilin Flp
MMKIINRFVQDDSGVTAIEYAGIAVFLSIVIVTVVNGIGGSLKASLMGVQFPGA